VTILVLDSDRTISFGNKRAKEAMGSGEIAGKPLEACPWELLEDGKLVPMEHRPFDIVRERNEPVYDLRYRARIDGEIRWLAINGAPLYHEGEFDGAVFAVEDITDRKHRDRTLSVLHETMRAMMRASSVNEIHDLAVWAASDLLSDSRVVSYRFDASEFRLRPAAYSPDTTNFVESHRRIEGGPIHSAFVEGSVTHDEEITAIPLGSHGVLAFLGGIDESSLSLARVVRDDMEAALDRTARKGVLRTQSERLRHANDELERLNHVTDLMRDVTDALVRATSRKEIMTTVCERLAAADPYRFAWIDEGKPPAPTACAGIAESALSSTADANSGENSPAALATGEAVLDRVGSVAHSSETEALANEKRSVAAVPLSHRDRSYGVLSVSADRTAFSVDEGDVLAELGETIGYAIRAIETRDALTSDSVTQLQFSIEDPKSLPATVAADASLDHRGIAPRADGSIRWFLRTDVQPARIEALFSKIKCVESVSAIRTDETTLLECVVRSPCLLTPFVEHATTITSISATATETTITAETAHEGNARAIRSALESAWKNVELIGRQDRERPPQTREERREAITHELTDRQHEILTITHASGYFETPKQCTGAELAARLDINRSTFHRTLRAAERAAFDALLE
jgi:PAS domain S-box-containing protein